MMLKPQLTDFEITVWSFFILEILSATSKVTEKTAVREGSAACWNLRMNDPSAFIAADRFWGSNILLLKKKY